MMATTVSVMAVLETTAIVTRFKMVMVEMAIYRNGGRDGDGGASKKT